MYINTFKEKLNAGKPALGCHVHGFALDNIQILGIIGYDFVFIDTEHGPMNLSQVEMTIIAAESKNLIPVVRCFSKDEKTILRFLELGAMGLVFPDVSSREEMEALVRYSKYYPQGNRGMSSMRAAEYGLTIPKAEYRKMANEQVMLIPMIESVAGVANCEAILSVPGVDAVLIGGNDLSQSMGIPGQESSSEVQQKITEVLEIANRLQIPAGYGSGSPEDFAEQLKRGFLFSMSAANKMFAAEGRRYLSALVGYCAE